jgi:hypothetical protein
MTKMWLVFLGGGVCGAAMALGLAQLFFRSSDGQRASNEAAEGGVRSANGAGREPLETRVTRGEEKAAPEPGLESRVARLQAWADGRGGEPDTSSLYEMLGEWAEGDPYAALAWVKSAKRLPQRLHMLAVPLTELARRSPAEAAGWLRQNVDAHDRASVLEGAFQRLSMDDARQALELATMFPDEEQPYDLGGALGTLVVDAPQEALAFFNRLTGARRESSAQWMLASWARADAAAAWAWAEGQRDVMETPQVRWAFLEECAQTRPDLCVDFFRKFPTVGRGGDDSHAVSGLLRRSPEHGVAALTLVPEATAQSALTMWAQENFERSPERALALLETWMPAETRGGVIRGGFESWLDSDQRAAMEWLGTVTRPELQAVLQAGVVAWQARRDPEAALAVLNGPQAVSPEFKDVAEQALLGWVQRDVTAAAGWVVANPDRVSSQQASEVAAMLLNHDEATGAEWLARLPAGAVRDAAVEVAAIHWAGQNELELAGQVAASIRDPEARTRAAFGVYNTLKYADGAAAEKWLETQGVSEETKQSWRAITSGR